MKGFEKRGKRTKRIYGGIACMVLLAVLVFMQPAYALLFTADKIFIGPQERSAFFKVRNTGKAPKAFRVEWAQLKMKEGGAKELISSEEEEALESLKPAEPYMFVAPRRLVIPPNQTQHIRFMVRRTRDMEPGEYRSYVVISPEEIRENVNFDDTKIKQAGKQAGRVNVLTGYRIPVFFLHGETTLDVSFSDIRLSKDNKGRDNLHFTLNRSGTRSALGEVTVTCQTAEGDAVISRGPVKVYTELDQRHFSRVVDLPPGGCGRGAINFTPHSGDPLYNGQPIASASLIFN